MSWRVAFYPWGYPTNPDGKPDSPLCRLCGPEVCMKWEPGLAVVAYQATPHNECCIRCGVPAKAVAS